MSCKSPKRVLLVGWDAADWQMINPLMDAGEMPNMKRFVDEGVSGNVATLQPALSPMLWTSIVSGKTADKHGVLGFAEADGTTGRVRPVTSTGRTCKALWNILSDHGRAAGAINWYASHPAEQINGFVVTDRFAHPTGQLKAGEPLHGWDTVPGSVWPQEDLEPLARTRVHPQMISQEQVLAFVPGATDPSSSSWDKIRELRVLLAHCATVHNAATAYLQSRDWDFMCVYYDAIDRFAHAFMEFHPPKMEHVNEEEFTLYRDVMNECYRFHDLMLGRLMKLIDDETAVMILSDHGFHSGMTRPQGTSGIVNGQPAAWHRSYGVIALWGPGIKAGSKLYGASLLDVTPTILMMLGMDPARDMDGLPLTQIWSEPRLSSQRVESYETPPCNDEKPHNLNESAVDEQILHQLTQLGYIGSNDATAITIDRTRNLGSVFMSTGRPNEALAQFERVRDLNPDTPGICLSIGSCLLSLGRLDEAHAMAMEPVGDENPTPRGRVLLAMICAQRGEHKKSIEHLKESQRVEPTLLGIDAHIGRGHVQLGNWEDAERAFERALERDSDDADALDGLGVVYQRTDRVHQAVLAHTQSIALVRQRSETHIHLGEALIGINRLGWAIESFVEAARISPWDPTPHSRLSDVYKKLVGNEAKSDFHSERAKVLRKVRKARIKENRRDPLPTDTTQHTDVPSSIASVQSQPDRASPPKQRDGPVTLVSGLPRSGTSLMMQMLEAGGMPILSDQSRKPDENNPRGYLELEAVKHTATDARWVEDAPGHAVKVIHALLPSLPGTQEYLVIFMKRRLDEIVESQDAMLRRMDRSGTTLGSEALRSAYAREYERIGAWLGDQPNFKVLEVSYNGLIAEPRTVIDAVIEFVGFDLDITAMMNSIDPGLYRQRSE